MLFSSLEVKAKHSHKAPNPCTLSAGLMYRNNIHQRQFEDFDLPFGGKLRSDNRWVKMAKHIPWEQFDALYAKSLSGSGTGSPALAARVALGALIIKERLGTSDEETVEQIRENPYLQYFLGFKAYRDEQPFDPSMFVHFRKRITKEMLGRVNEQVVQKGLREAERIANRKKHPKDPEDSEVSEPPPKNKGKLLVDATCAPADITFPTDLKLLNDAREKSEKIIDILHKPFVGLQKKPRTCRKVARKKFLTAAKSKRLTTGKRRKALRSQLGYLRRNLKTIAEQSEQTSLLVLNRRQYKNLLVIHEIYSQQQKMFDDGVNRVDDRIVSLFQPHVRPIMRGKAGVKTEFGAKLSVSLVDGFTFVDRINWNNYNEAGDLKDQINAYRDRFGFYPASVHADKLYRNRDNRRFCKKWGIRLSGPALGRPPKNIDPEVKAQAHRDERVRVLIEGKFGQGKRRFTLGRIMSKLAATSETTISLIFLVMNIERWLKEVLFLLFLSTQSRLKDLFGRSATLMRPFQDNVDALHPTRPLLICMI